MEWVFATRRQRSSLLPNLSLITTARGPRNPLNGVYRLTRLGPRTSHRSMQHGKGMRNQVRQPQQGQQQHPTATDQQ
eukprot:4794548-Amphidinium_carterae.1